MTITADALLEEVAAEVGLDDFGHPSYRDGLDVFLDAVQSEAMISAIGAAAVDSQTRQALRNRLRVTDWVKQHPDVAAAPVRAPLFILGQPRTGTTAMSHLLSADPANRSLLMWEAAESVPPPRAETYWDDPRFVAARNAPNMLHALNPEFKAIHYDPPEAAVECAVPLSQHFASISLTTQYNMPSYDDWILSTDLTHAYAWHKQVLQVLQSEAPGRWQLKSPVHCYGMDALSATYPDARFIWTHRDPVEVIASVTSLVRSLTSTFTDADHTSYIGEHWPWLVGQLIERLMAYRDRAGEDAFCDLAYRDIVRDPVDAARQVYERFGMELTAEAEAGMREWHENRPQHQFGKHTYSLDDFGLRADDIRERFSAYYDRFGEYL